MTTRKAQLLDAFRVAGRRGLTAGEMQARVGVMWRLRLRELRADGCVFLETPSRLHPGKTFRWVLILEPRTAGGDDEHGRLFDPPSSPPRSALDGDL